jgi:hypothetical protein
MATHRRSSAGDARRSSRASSDPPRPARASTVGLRSLRASALARILVPLALAAVALPIAAPQATAVTHARVVPAGTWPAAAREMAGTVASRWAANVRASARLGTEPPGSCRRLDGRHAACPIGIAVLANGPAGRRPWRCSATVLVSRAGAELAARRMHTRCTPFPSPPAIPDPAAALGTAVALQAKGDVACLPANDARVTCVMTYVTRPGEHCTAAVSVPLTRLPSSVPLGPPLCAAGDRRS